MVCIVLLIAAVTFTQRPTEVSARGHEGDPFNTVRIRYEGYLKAIGPGKWFIGDLTVLVDRNTAIIEKRGRAEPGAWLVVFGSRNDAGAIYGEVIQVERPAGRSGPILQFSGLVTKQVEPWWVVGDMLVEVTTDTQVIGQPGLNWLVWVVAEQRLTELRALTIEGIADSPDLVPVEFSGVLEAYGPTGGIIEGRRFVFVEDPVIIGEPAVGLQAELQGRVLQDGTLVAHLLRIRPSAAASGLGNGVGAAAGPLLNRMGWPSLANSNQADVSLWTAPTLVANGMNNASHPTLVFTPDGTAHMVWEAGGYLFHAERRPGQDWGAARRSWMGQEPALSVDRDGRLHLVFSNQLLDARNIYHSRYVNGTWTFPVNVSRTSGNSAHPALAADNNGGLRAVWMDMTPGYWVIYAAHWADSFWSNGPIPNARGESPAVAVAPDNTVFIAWQDRTPTPDNPSGNYNIFLCERAQDSWTLPVNISDRTDRDAEAVSLAAGADGLAHLVWVEDGRTVRWTFGRGFYWPVPVTIVQAATMARGPRIATGDHGALYVAWDEENLVRATYALRPTTAWPKPEVITSPMGTVKDVWLVKEGNGATLAWIQETVQNGTGIYTAHRRSPLPFRTWMPALVAP